MTTGALVLAALLLHGRGTAVDPGISLHLLAPEKHQAGGKSDPDAQLEALEARAHSGSPVPIELSVIVQANRAGDVWVDRNALRLEVRDLSGAPFRQSCIIEPDYLGLPRTDDVRLQAGQTMTLRLRLGRHVPGGARASVCFQPGPNLGRGFAVVAVYEPADQFPFRLPPRNGATPLAKQVVSNLVSIRPAKAP